MLGAFCPSIYSRLQKPVAPVVGFSTAMHDGKDEDGVGFNGVENAIRKATGKASADVFFDDGPSVWHFKNLVQDRLDLVRESNTGGRANLFVETRLLVEFTPPITTTLPTMKIAS